MSGRSRGSARHHDEEQGAGSPPARAAPPPAENGGQNMLFTRSMSHMMRDTPASGGSMSQGPKRGWNKLRGMARGMGALSAMRTPSRATHYSSGSSRLTEPLVPEGDEDEEQEGGEREGEAEGGEHRVDDEAILPDLPAPPKLRASMARPFQSFRRLSDSGPGTPPGERPLPACAVIERTSRGRLQRTKTGDLADAGVMKSVVMGFINALVGIPAQTAFATIVFQDAIYAPFLGALCKFFFFSSAVHAIVFMILSTLPYAVGQVQDVGLIFLSSMATSIATICTTAELDPKVALGTTLVTFCLATFTVGLLTLVVGKLRLAQLVEYVPLPVVGGYLGYVGYFIIAGGAGLVAGVQLDNVVNWFQLFTWDRGLKLLAMLATTCTVMKSLEFPAMVLPATLVAIPLLFHALLWLTGISLEQCQEGDWVMKPMPGGDGQFWELWRFFNLDFSDGLPGLLASVHWPALVQQLAKVAGLFLVVCFGSGMDVAAIQQDSIIPIDFNQEMITVGASNMVTAALGAGYTGSYIFSQTIFTMKAGIKTRLSSAVIVLIELAVFAVPFSVVQLVPKFFFGALLLWFGYEIVNDWLIKSSRKLSKMEYVLLWLTFLAIMWTGLEVGIAAGIVMVTLAFAFEYALCTVSALSPVSVSSGTVYSYSHMSLLNLMVPRRAVGLTLSGFLFFGNSISISEKVEQIAIDMVKQAEAEEKELVGVPEPEREPSLPDLGSPKSNALETMNLARLAFAQTSIRARSSDKQSSEQGRRFGSMAMEKVTLMSMVETPMFIILDFRLVPRLDSTSAKTFASLANKLESKGIELLISGLPADPSSPLRTLLAAHRLQLVAHASWKIDMESEYAAFAVAGEEPEEEELQELHPGQVWEFPNLELASKFCEDQILLLGAENGLVDDAMSTVQLQDVLRMHMDSLPHAHIDPVATLLMKYMTTIKVTKGQVLFKQGAALDGLYIIQSGKLHLHTSSWSCGGGTSSVGTRKSSARGQGLLPIGEDHGLAEEEEDTVDKDTVEKVKTTEYGPGSLVCPHDFSLRRPASATARCFTLTSTVLLLSYEAYEKLMTNEPAALGALQIALTRSLSMDITSFLGLVDKSGPSNMMSFSTNKR